MAHITREFTGRTMFATSRQEEQVGRLAGYHIIPKWCARNVKRVQRGSIEIDEFLDGRYRCCPDGVFTFELVTLYWVACTER